MIIVAVMVILLLTMALIIFIVNTICYGIKKKSFTSVLWENKPEKRYELVDSLIKKEILIGLTKFEVIDTLGYEFNDMNSNKWVYLIGYQPGIRPFQKMKLVLVFMNNMVVDVWMKK